MRPLDGVLVSSAEDRVVYFNYGQPRFLPASEFGALPSRDLTDLNGTTPTISMKAQPYGGSFNVSAVITNASSSPTDTTQTVALGLQFPNGFGSTWILSYLALEQTNGRITRPLLESVENLLLSPPPEGGITVTEPPWTNIVNGVTAVGGYSTSDGMSIEFQLRVEDAVTSSSDPAVPSSHSFTYQLYVLVSLKLASQIAGEETSSAPVQILRHPEGGFLVMVDAQVIRIRSQTDIFGGLQMAQTVFEEFENGVRRTLLNQYLPAFKDYLIDNPTGSNCTLVDKATYIANTYFPLPESKQYIEQILGRLSLYGLLRYFLWYLITGELTLRILLDEHTPLFFAFLAASSYSIFLKAFETDLLKGLNVYFKPTVELLLIE